MTIIVTGAAGFIGSNIVKALNQRGITDIVAVDNLTRGEKFKNLAECEIAHYLDKHEFIRQVRGHLLPYENIEAVFHQGACSDTMNHDGLYMMDNNYQYTLDLLDWCQDERIPFLYASSAAVYGKGETFREERELEEPLNVYGYSKFLFDQVVRRRIEEGLTAQVAGFRYFNVYGMREQHKGRMASVAFHHFNQYREQGYVNLFGGYDGYPEGGQSRDFVSVEDVVKVNLFFLDNSEKSLQRLGRRPRQCLPRRRRQRPPAAGIAGQTRPNPLHRISRRAQRQIPKLHPSRHHPPARRGL